MKQQKEGWSNVEFPAGGYRNWSDLPGLPLRSIMDHLILFPDLFSFAGVCSSWRSLFLDSASSKDALKSRPPMLLRPIRKLDKNMLRHKMKNPARCLLSYPWANLPATSYSCRISSNSLYGSCIGCSFGKLIIVDKLRLVDRRRRLVIIADVFTGDDTITPDLPLDAPWYDRGFLTGPLYSPDCRLILSGSGTSAVAMWRVGSREWTEHPLLPPIQQLLLFKQRVYALDFSQGIHALHFSAQLTFELLEGVGPLPSLPSLVRQLVECGDELLFVSLEFCSEGMSKLKFSGFRLDFSEKVWVEVKDLGDWALFIDACGRCPMSCANATAWGGRNNCVYFVGSECDSWGAYPFGEVLLSDNLTMGSPLFLVENARTFCPTPMWVYPSVLSK